MNYENYTESFKENAVKQLLSPNSPGIQAICKKTGVPKSTLYSWKAKYANIGDMKKPKKKTRLNNYSPEQKLEIINKTYSMNEQELGEYLRSEGLHSGELESFKKDLLSGSVGKGRPKLDPEVSTLRKEVLTLNRTLRKTQSALAEQSARIILLKKSHEIWGVREDEE